MSYLGPNLSMEGEMEGGESSVHEFRLFWRFWLIFRGIGAYLGSFSWVWAQIRHVLAHFPRVCAYFGPKPMKMKPENKVLDKNG